MKILLATDGSPHARAALEELLRRPWPPESEVRVVSVAHPIPYVPDPLMLGAAAHADSVPQERLRAKHDAAEACERLRGAAPSFTVSECVLEGSPKRELVREAERWGADLIVLGSHGHGPVGEFLLGSVALAVVHHAPCSVEVVRSPEAHAEAVKNEGEVPASE